MRSERDQWHVSLRGERARHQHGPAERLAHPSSRLARLTAGPIAGEIEPVGGADIAPQHLAEMQRRTERERRQTVGAALRVEIRHPGFGCACGTQSRIARVAR